jgi:hypothetical protein
MTQGYSTVSTLLGLKSHEGANPLANQRGGKHCLAGYIAFSTKASAIEDGTIPDGEVGRVVRYWGLSWPRLGDLTWCLPFDHVGKGTYLEA